MPVVRVEREEERLGGAANVALNVRSLGAQATLLTVVGDDEPAHRPRRCSPNSAWPRCSGAIRSCARSSSCA